MKRFKSAKSQLPISVGIWNFLQTTKSYTKYRQFRRRFPRLKIIASNICEIWSTHLVFIDSLLNFNKGVKYLVVAVFCFLQKLRVQPMRTKGVKTTDKTFDCMITRTEPLKLWSDKGTKIKGGFEKFVNIKALTLHHKNWTAISLFRAQ